MALNDLFSRNPFHNLAVAGVGSAEHPIRGSGHEKLRKRFEEIEAAVIAPYSPENAQHTIVYGEWGHGKSHVLRLVEHHINVECSKHAKAIFFEPESSDPQSVFSELAVVLGLDEFGDPERFVRTIKEKLPNNLFILIDETQQIVGEGVVSSSAEKGREYWSLLEDIIDAAQAHSYGLHIFHGLSLNTAEAMRTVGKISAFKKLKRKLLTLESLDEESQWEMLCDRMERTVESDDVPEWAEVIDRGVSRCIHELTGGNPRHALGLMESIYRAAEVEGAEKVNGVIAYKVLSKTPTRAATRRYYFDEQAANDLVEDLSKGLQFEQWIGGMLKVELPRLLGEWLNVDSSLLSAYKLTSVDVRRPCQSLNGGPILFRQDPGRDDLRLSPDLLRLLHVTRRHSVTDSGEMDRSLVLAVQPEVLLTDMSRGLHDVLRNSSEGMNPQYVEMETKIAMRACTAKLPGTYTTGAISVCFAVYKGPEVDQDIYERLVYLVEKGDCTAVVVLEDAGERSHKDPGSTYDSFQRSYKGSLDLDQRFVFINGNDDGDTFDEDFFVRLTGRRIDRDDADEWWERLRLASHLKKIADDCVYCPNLQHRNILGELYARASQSFSLKDIDGLGPDMGKPNQQAMRNLVDGHCSYLEKSRNRYQARDILEVPAFKFTLAHLQGADDPSSVEDVQHALRSKYLLTGESAQVSEYAQWVLGLLEKGNRVQKDEDGRYQYKDIASELQTTERNYKTALSDIKRECQDFKKLEVEEDSLSRIEAALREIEDRAETFERISPAAIISEYKDASRKLEVQRGELGKIPDAVRKQLMAQSVTVRELLSEVWGKAHWPLDDSKNPYQVLYLNEFSEALDKVDATIDKDKELAPQRKSRQQIEGISNNLSAVSALLEEKLVDGQYEDIGEQVTRIFNAIRDRKSGRVTVTMRPSS